MTKRKSFRVLDLRLDGQLVSSCGKDRVRVANLGPDGAFVETQRFPKVNEKVTLELSLPSHPIPVVLAGEVRWIRDGAGVGVQFAKVAGFLRAALDDYCQHCLDRAKVTMGIDGASKD